VSLGTITPDLIVPVVTRAGIHFDWGIDLKKLACVILAAMAVACMCAVAVCCGCGTSNSANKSVCVYFSTDDHTKRAAKLVAEMTGSEIFALEPTEAYTTDDLDFSNVSSRVSREFASGAEGVELVSCIVPNWDAYNTVYFCYPIWKDQAAWPVNEFVRTADFDDKTVVPFCTSDTSAGAGTEQALASMANSGNWQEAKRFSTTFTDAEVEDWARSVS
jgi:hypothetical protein